MLDKFMHSHIKFHVLTTCSLHYRIKKAKTEIVYYLGKGTRKVKSHYLLFERVYFCFQYY